MIKLVTGKLGAGKTLYCVAEMLDLFCKGRTVATNIALNWDEMCRLALSYKGVILDRRQWVEIDPNKDRNWHLVPPWGVLGGPVAVYLDEIHLFFNARNWQQTASVFEDLVSFLTQSRKACMDITFIAQDGGTIDKSFRVQCEFEYYVVNGDHLPLGIIGQLPFKFFIVCIKDPVGEFTIRKEYRGYDKRLFAVYGSHTFLDTRMQELSEKAVRVRPYKLQRVGLVRRIRERIRVEFKALFRRKHLRTS